MGVRRDGLLLMLALWLELARCFLFDLTLRTFVEFILPRASLVLAGGKGPCVFCKSTARD